VLQHCNYRKKRDIIPRQQSTSTDAVVSQTVLIQFADSALINVRERQIVSVGLTAEQSFARYQQWISSGQMQSELGFDAEQFTRMTPAVDWAPPAVAPAVGLSDSSIVGIVVGSTVGAIIIAGVLAVIIFVLKKKRVENKEANPATGDSVDNPVYSASGAEKLEHPGSFTNMVFINHRGSVVDPLPSDNKRTPPSDLGSGVVQVARLPTGRMKEKKDSIKK